MIERVSWGGWPNCYRLQDGPLEAIVTSDIGPRILRFGFTNGPNLLLEIKTDQGTTAEQGFVSRGGHRLWVAPEDAVGTYAADNLPCDCHIHDDMLQVTGPVEVGTGFRKQLRVRFDETGSLEIVHRLQNTMSWNVKASIWALTMMAPGGHGITGFPPRGTHPECLAPTNPLVMWAFTDLTDPRLTFTPLYLVLRQDQQYQQPFKLGHFNVDTWGAYLLGDELFLKRYRALTNVSYPDFGCSFEIFTNGVALELETLSPLTQIEPGAWLEHIEYWSLHPKHKVSNWNNTSIDELLRGCQLTAPATLNP